VNEDLRSGFGFAKIDGLEVGMNVSEPHCGLLEQPRKLLRKPLRVLL